jgi:KDO2-lipid IV(A) lauroyltransferase
MVKYWVFRSAAVLVPRIPIQISRPLASFASFFIWMLARGSQRQVQRNLRHIPALANDPEQLYWATRGVFQHLALNYLDFFRGAHLSDKELKAGWTIVNQAAYDEAMAKGRGLILLGSHFGNFEFAASRLGALGYKLLTPVERVQPEALFDLFCQIRQHHNLRLVPADSRDSLREMLDALKRGEVVMILADRYVMGASAEIPFFDSPAKMPTGPMSLAQRSGAPVIMAYSWREGPGRSYGAFVPLDINTDESVRGETTTHEGALPALSSSRRAEKTATRVRTGELAAEGQRQYLQELEKAIEQHPEQWVATLWPIWDADR